jgi:hypothetical protein
MRTANQCLAIVLWVAAFGMFCCKVELLGVLLFVSLAFWPQFVTHVGVFKAKAVASQCILTLTLGLYFACFVHVYIDAFYTYRDAQSAVLIMFGPLLVVPLLNIEAYWILIVLWSLVLLIELRLRLLRST